MSMVINLVEDHNIYLCEGGPVYNGGVSPTPITYLTQWKIVGNSEVHTDPYLTSWKVSGNSQVHTLPYPDGVVLPTGYKRCKYLEFHGTEYFESGVASKQGIGMTFQFKTSTEEKFIAGVRNGHTGTDPWKSTFVFGFLETSSLIVSYGDYMQEVASTNYADGVKHTVVLDDTTAKVDNTNITLTRGTIATSLNIPIGSLRSLNNIDTRMYVGYLYNFVLYDANGTLFNGIPCLDDNDVPCLYDTVSGTTLYNQGTGTCGYELEPQPTEIWSCGDLGQDGKYHVKISNGVDIYDIALNEPLRKVNDVADTIEFPSGTKALVTRKFYQETITKYQWLLSPSKRMYCRIPNIKGAPAYNIAANILFPTYPTLTHDQTVAHNYGVSVQTDDAVCFYDENYQSSDMINAFKEHISGLELLYELNTPTTELVDAPQIAVSPTDTYISANVTPYSAFEHTENKEIWSCGEYNATDRKYHILVQPLGGSIADIALTEPLRKVNDIADTIEFPSGTEGKALVTRRLLSQDMGSISWSRSETRESGIYRMMSSENNLYKAVDNNIIGNILCAIYNAVPAGRTYQKDIGCGVSLSKKIFVYDPDYNQSDSVAAFTSYVNGYNVILELATPTTELVDAPQIEEADSYSMVISQGGKSVSWSDFITDKEQLYAYGVQWDKTSESPICTRIGNMELHKASKLPVQNAMRGCLLNDNGEVVQYLSDSDWQNASLLDGSQGQVMIEIPDFYWKFSEDANGIQSVMLSMVEIEGYKKVNKMYVSAYQATIDRTNSKLASVKNNTPQYRGGRNDSSKDGTYRSQLGKPAVNFALAGVRNYARARKANSTEWNLYTYLTHKVLYWLFVVEYATRKSQTAIDSTLTTEGYRKGGLGNGVTTVSETAWVQKYSYEPIIPVGVSDSIGNGTGEVSYNVPDTDNETTWVTVNVPRYRGIENPFGCFWQLVDGARVLVEVGDNGKSKVYTCYDTAHFDDADATNWNYIGDEARSTDFVKEIIFGDNGDIMCKTNGGNTDKYFTDFHVVNTDYETDTWKQVGVGGLASHGTRAGLSATYSQQIISYTGAMFIGTRLTFIPSTD